MNDAERLMLIRLFLTGIGVELERAGREGSSVPLNMRVFAQTAKRLCGQNAFARRFQVYPSPCGPHCPDAVKGIAIAQSAGLLSRKTNAYDYISVELSPRQIRELSTFDGFAEAHAFVRAYLRATMGFPRDRVDADAMQC